MKKPRWKFLWIILTAAISSLISIIPVLINVAFITLFERKILRITQNRKGPNKVRLKGVLQPFSDAIKLFAKENIIPFRRAAPLFTTPPLLALCIILLLWNFPITKETPSSYLFSAIFFLVVIRLRVYPLLLAGWASNRKYSLIGALRGIAQTISYEINLALLLLRFLIILNSYEIIINCKLNLYCPLILLILPITILWVLSCVAETNRTPFDFAEGESELVSGFNTEYSGALFALVFIAEYARIFFLSLFSTWLFIIPHCSIPSAATLSLILIFFWVWIRRAFPRYRYDILMNLSWKSILPLTLIGLIFNVTIRLII